MYGSTSFDKCIQLYALSFWTFPLLQEIPSRLSLVKHILHPPKAMNILWLATSLNLDSHFWRLSSPSWVHHSQMEAIFSPLLRISKSLEQDKIGLNGPTDYLVSPFYNKRLIIDSSCILFILDLSCHHFHYNDIELHYISHLDLFSDILRGLPALSLCL